VSVNLCKLGELIERIRNNASGHHTLCESYEKIITKGSRFSELEINENHLFNQQVNLVQGRISMLVFDKYSWQAVATEITPGPFEISVNISQTRTRAHRYSVKRTETMDFVSARSRRFTTVGRVYAQHRNGFEIIENPAAWAGRRPTKSRSSRTAVRRP
jgi:hypothetical protein